MVELSTLYLNLKGSGKTNAAGTRRGKWQKEAFRWSTAVAQWWNTCLIMPRSMVHVQPMLLPQGGRKWQGVKWSAALAQW
jgi:hypothetical protein